MSKSKGKAAQEMDLSQSVQSARSTMESARTAKSVALDQSAVSARSAVTAKSAKSDVTDSVRTPKDVEFDDDDEDPPKTSGTSVSKADLDGEEEPLEPYFDEEVDGSSTVVVDPQSYKRHLTSKVNICVAILNVILGVVYVVWRVFRGMVKDRAWTHWKPPGAEFVPEDDQVWDFNREMRANWFCWLFLFAEVLLMISIWHSHISRFWPLKRTKCTMNDLMDADYELSRNTQVTIVLPVRGKPLALLREVIMAIMSLHLWPGKLDVRRNLRLVVSDDDRRPEVVVLVSLCYKFASLCLNHRKIRAQLKREGRPFLTMAQFFDYYLQCTAGFGRTHDEAYTELFGIGDMIFKLCRENCIPAEWEGVELPEGRRVEASVSTDIAHMPRLREDYDEVRNLPSIVYFSRADPATPARCPAAGELNDLLFPEDPADADVLGDAKFLVINDPCHAFQTEYLQRTIPYFFKLQKEKGSSEIHYVVREDIAFVTIPPRFQPSRDRDPLGYRDHIRFDIEGVGRDGMGGVVANDHGSIYRMDVLKDGKDAKGKQIVPEAKMKNRESVGKGLGFSDRTIKEHLTTSIDLFCRGYRSVYVNEAHETLTLCLDESTELDDKIQGVYDRYRASLEILAQDPLGLAKAKYANSWQRSYIMEDLVSEFIRGFAVVLIIICITLYCFLWKTPFNIHNIEFLFYFIPYYVSAALPTAIAMNWKLIQPDPTFRSVQVAFSLSFVAMYAGLACMAGEFSRVFCSRSGRRRSMVATCPTWPLYFFNASLLAALIVCTVHWITHHYNHPGQWMTQVCCVTVALTMMWPITRRGSRMRGFSSFFMRYAVLGIMLVIIGLWSGAAPDAFPNKNKKTT